MSHTVVEPSKIVAVAGPLIVPVDYAPLPSFADLEKEFGEGNVSNLFDQGLVWEKRAAREGLVETPGDKAFFLFRFDRRFTDDVAIALMAGHGCRPACHIEAYAFQRSNPELQRRIWVIALGSSASFPPVHGHAVLRSNRFGRVLDFYGSGSIWDSTVLFLAVKK